MSQFHSNLKFLRNKKGLSQQELSDQLQMGRSTLAEYERGKAEPSMGTLIRLAEIFQVSLDDLVRKNLEHHEYEIIRNKDLRVLAITVDRDNRSNIELVDTKAEAGYLESAQDPEYIRDLPKIWFPNIPEGTYRGFEIQGESMLPMEPGTIVICSFIEKLSYIKPGRTYVIVTRAEGLVYKRVQVNSAQKSLLLFSDNELFAPYAVPFTDIKEIWEYFAHLSFSDSRQLINNMIDEKLSDIQQKVQAIHAKVNER